MSSLWHGWCKPVEFENGVAAGLIGRESHFRCSTGTPAQGLARFGSMREIRRDYLGTGILIRWSSLACSGIPPCTPAVPATTQLGA